MPREAAIPPEPTTAQGTTRRVGVEIEFHGLDVPRSAELVRQLYGGRVEVEDKHRCIVHGTRFGKFRVELDSQYAHKKPGADLASKLEAELAPVIGDITAVWMPIEIAAPPIPWDRLGELEPLVAALREGGACGTFGSILFAFGLQLNPEAARLDPDWIVSQLKAYLVLSDWLRAEIGVDLKRRLLPFVAHFPRDYALQVTDPAYWPDRDRLVDDYLIANPTRNRELDLLPLFAHLDAPRVRRAVSDALVKPRPALHYRLPNSQVDDPDWGILVEWERWLRVERLAADEPRLDAACRAFRSHPDSLFGSSWAEDSRVWAGA